MELRPAGRRPVPGWAVLWVGLALTLAAAVTLPALAPPQYQSTARLLLLLPPEARSTDVNPYLNLPNGLIVLSMLVAQAPDDDRARDAMAAEGLESQFEVGLDPSRPEVNISVEGTDAENVVRTRDWLVALLERELLRIQEEEGAPPRHVADTYEILAEPAADRIQGEPLRAMAGFAAGGTVLTLLAALAVERRRSSPVSDFATPETGGFFPAWMFVALFALLLLVIPTRLVVGPIGAPGAPANLLALGGLLWWTAATLGGQLRRFDLSPLRLGVGLLVGVTLLSYAFGHVQGWYQPADVRPRYGARNWRLADVAEMTDVASSASDRGLLALAGWIGITLVTAEGIRTWREMHRVLAWVVGAATVVAAIGVVQYFTGFNAATLIDLPGLSASAEFGRGIARSDLVRVVSTSTHPIELGVVMACLLPIALHVGLYTKRLIGWLPTLMIGLATLMTVSRSGIVVAAVALVVLFLGWPARWRVMALLALPVMGLVGPVALPGLLGTIRSLFTNLGDDPSITGRTDDYELVFRLIGEHPLFGLGLFTFVPMVYRTIDNQALVLLLEIGVVGTVAFVALILVGVAHGVSVHRRGRDDQERHAGLAVTASLAGIVTSYITFDALGFRQVAGLTFLFLGLAGALWGLTRRAERTHHG